MKPMEGRACCCARAPSGQAPSDTTLTANVVMKSRRFTFCPRGFVSSPPNARPRFVDCEGTAAQSPRLTLSDVRRMSALPQKRTSELSRGMSAMCQKQTLRDAAKRYLFGHLVQAVCAAH